MFEEILDTAWLMIGTEFTRARMITYPVPTLENASKSITVDPIPVAGQPVTARILESNVACLKDGDWIRGEATNEVAGDVMVATDWRGRNYYGTTYPYDTERVLLMDGMTGRSYLLGREFTLIKIVQRKPAKGKTWRLIQSKEQWLESRKSRQAKAAATRAAKKQLA